MKNFKTVLIPTVTLTVICALLGAALAFTNGLTADKIAAQDAEKQKTAMQKALPADNYTELGERDGCVIYKAESGSETIGYVVSSSQNGYGGKISVMVGVLPDNSIKNIDIVSCDDETAGLGQRIKEDSFMSQFSGIKGKVEFGENADAITGATISSKAVRDAVNKALSAVESEVTAK